MGCKLNDKLRDEFCNYLIVGGYIGTASAMVGVDHDTINNWLKKGAREIEKQKVYDKLCADFSEAKKLKKPTADEVAEKEIADAIRVKERRKGAKFVDFKKAVELAMARCELGDLSVIAMSAKGGHVIETTTTTNPKTKVVTKKEKLSRPEWQASAWRLERRNPKRWGRFQRVELSGDEQKPIAFMTLTEAAKQAHEASEARKKSEKNGQKNKDKKSES